MEMLSYYKHILQSVQQPILAICLGLRILGYIYSARIRRMPKGEYGIVKIHFQEEYPLAPGVEVLDAYETVSYTHLTLPTKA